MTKPHLRSVAMVFAMSMSCAAASARPVNFDADSLTTSGRFDLPSAKGSPFFARVKVQDLTVDPTTSKLLDLEAPLVKTALLEAVSKSLHNFGYLAPGDQREPTQITIDYRALNLVPDHEGLSARVRLRISIEGSSDTLTGACLPYEASAEFRAMTPIHNGGGQKAASVATAVALAFVGVNAGVFMANQFASADAQDRVLNGARQQDANHAVAPSDNDTDLRRFAVIRATQLAIADLIAHLGAAPECKTI